jgi:starch-binding outer membrane protein, SusD/RagB family
MLASKPSNKKKMKIYKYVVLSLVLATGSCTGVIEDVNPTHILSDSNAFARATDYETALSGAYAQLRAVNVYGRDQSSLPDMMTDNLSESPENLPQGTRGLVDWQAASDNGQIENNWTLVYRMINATNIVINGIDAFANAGNQRTVNRIKGQALALRALGHFDLLKWYANNYERNSGDPAVPISTASASTDPKIKPARATVREVYDQIFRDLNEAAQLLANVDAAINTASNRSRIDATVVSALLARVSLYAGQWADAIRFSTEVINRIPLATRAQFPGIWNDANIAEVVWHITFNPGEGGPAIEVYSPGSDRASYDASPDLVALYDQANDVRFASYITQGFRIRVARAATRYVVTKYLGKGATRDGAVNFKAFRTAEMLLIRAEANARSGNGAAALNDLNLLRVARITGFQPGTESGAALLDAIANERRRELFVEGHRWFDLKRTTRTIARQGCRPPATACNLAANNFRWTWPIPNNEILANSSVTQNSGY